MWIMWTKGPQKYGTFTSCGGLHVLAAQQLLTPLFARALFWFCTSTVYAAFLFRDMYFGDIVKLLESNVLICFLKITTTDLRKIGLKTWE